MITGLAKGTSGTEVRSLQEALNGQGGHLLPDGNFDAKTDEAVRAFQRRTGLLPDGIAGPRTLETLTMMSTHSKTEFPSDNLADLMLRIGSFIAGSALTAMAQPFPPMLSQRPRSLHTSKNGLRFIYSHETQESVSNRLHWPKGASGVTLGPGYDMKTRKEQAIIDDMIAIDLKPETAQKVAEASGLAGREAQEFANNNSDLVNLTPQQQMRLLSRLLPNYEPFVKRPVQIDLLQHEFDALVCFAYNAPKKVTDVANLMNHGRIVDAMQKMNESVASAGEVFKTLVNRRHDEIALYLYGDYGRLRG
jgi:peptidoglycan hydrolase-like protein with peptidoglycan-binding domain